MLLCVCIGVVSSRSWTTPVSGKRLPQAAEAYEKPPEDEFDAAAIRGTLPGAGNFSSSPQHVKSDTRTEPFPEDEANYVCKRMPNSGCPDCRISSMRMTFERDPTCSSWRIPPNCPVSVTPCVGAASDETTDKYGCDSFL